MSDAYCLTELCTKKPPYVAIPRCGVARREDALVLDDVTGPHRRLQLCSEHVAVGSHHPAEHACTKLGLVACHDKFCNHCALT